MCGHLEIIEFLHENRSEGCTVQVINYAAKKVELKVIKILYVVIHNIIIHPLGFFTHKTNYCANEAMHLAIKNGFIEVVDFLLRNRICSSDYALGVNKIAGWPLSHFFLYCVLGVLYPEDGH
eukprot:Pgem_evm1s18889